MCEKHKTYFKKKLSDWKTEIVRTNNEIGYQRLQMFQIIANQYIYYF